VSTLDDFVFTVASVAPATPSTRIVSLDLGGAPFEFKAGQAALIGLAEREERVPYSIASAPAETIAKGWVDFLIKFEPSGRWGHQFDSLELGNQMGIRGPMGSFTFPVHSSEKELLFVAGGTGIAPIRAMVRQALTTGHAGRIKLLYSARTANDFAYLEELQELASEKQVELRLHITRDAPAAWRGERGRIGLAQLTPLVDDRSTMCFVCGPESMVAEVPRMLGELGIDSSRIRVEEWK
jgi:CDP-4-dehydro-6-deoxyglucose reductase/3-phenylpropionate/trans-cinnamate dioxygenase ferredoxin reductase subunit